MNFDQLTSQDKQFHFAKVESILASKQLFLKFKFSLPELAQEAGMQLHMVSYLIQKLSIILMII